MMDRIELRDIQFECMVGLLEPEQRIIQPLIVDIEMELPLAETASTGALHTSINYADTANQTVFIAQHGRWRLLESFCVAVCRLVLATPNPLERRGQVHETTVTVRKPVALSGLATPVIKMTRDLAWAERTAKGGHLEILEETPLSAAYRLQLGPSQPGELPLGMAMLVLAGSGTTVNGEALQAGSRLPRDYTATKLTAGPNGLVALLVGRPQS